MLSQAVVDHPWTGAGWATAEVALTSNVYQDTRALRSRVRSSNPAGGTEAGAA